MAFPVLFHDDSLDEPACTGCMACVNYCPTQCISVTVDRNPRFLGGASNRKTIATSFEIDLSQCVECGICVEMCDHEAIALGLSKLPPGESRVDMRWLEERGREFEANIGHEAAVEKPDLMPLLEAARHRLPPASSSDGARRAWSRLKNSIPINMSGDSKTAP